MTKSRHPKDASPVLDFLALTKFCQAFQDLIGQIGARRNNVKYPSREFHYTQRMFEPTMRGPRVNEIGKRQLMNVPQTLEWSGIENLALGAIQAHKDVNRIPDLVYVLRHSQANNEEYPCGIAARGAEHRGIARNVVDAYREYIPFGQTCRPQVEAPPAEVGRT